MAASNWDTYLASKALLQKYGSVAAVKAAAKEDPSVEKSLTAGLEAWSDLQAKVKAAASNVDIVIPVRDAALLVLRKGPSCRRTARSVQPQCGHSRRS